MYKKYIIELVLFKLILVNVCRVIIHTYAYTTNHDSWFLYAAKSRWYSINTDAICDHGVISSM